MAPQPGGPGPGIYIPLHLMLNMTTRPIANKYRELKLKRTLKRVICTQSSFYMDAGPLDLLSCAVQYSPYNAILCH
jgi:hypothetical protein